MSHFIDDGLGSGPEPFNSRGAHHVGHHEEPVVLVAIDLFIGEDACHGHRLGAATPRNAQPLCRSCLYPGGMELTVLGSTVRHSIDHVEVFPAPANVASVRFTTDEVQSICPVTQQPDLSRVVIEYAPDQWCVESKSLKLYLWGFRDRAVFAEALTAEIAGEIMATANLFRAGHRIALEITCLDLPTGVAGAGLASFATLSTGGPAVTLTQRPRGGIEVEAVARLERSSVG